MRIHAKTTLSLVLLLLLAACGDEGTDEPTQTGTSGGEAEQEDAPPPDASLPEDATAIVRTGPLGPLLTAFLPSGLPITADAVPLEELTGGEAALAEHIDRERGVHMLFGGDDLVAWSVGVRGTIPASRLTNGTRGELDTGARWALHRTPDANGAGEEMHCILADAADGKRLICGDDRARLVRAAPYVARTLAQISLDGPEIRFEPILDSPAMGRVRETIPAALQEVVASVERELGQVTTGILANEEVKREVLAFVRSLVDAVRSAVADVREADVRLSVVEGDYVLETRARYHTISSEWLSAIMAALRTPAGWPTDLFGRLPNDGITYALGTNDSRDVAPIVAQVKSLTHAVLGSAASLPAADRDALRTAIDALFAPEVSLTASASTTGRDMWNIVIARTIEGPTPADRIARFRAVRAALARRGIASALESALTVSGRPLFLMRDVRDMSAREVPTGGYGVRFKLRAAAPLVPGADGLTPSCGTELECALRQLAPSEDTTFELLLAPMGDDFVMVLAKQGRARALFPALSGSAGPGLSPGEPAMAEVLIVPSRFIARTMEQLGAPPVTVDFGDRPVVMRIEPAGDGPGGLIDFDMRVPVALVRALVGIAVTGLGAAREALSETAEGASAQPSP